MSSEISRRAEKAADNAWVKLAARISLPVLAFLGMQAWTDVRDQGRQINQVLLNQAVSDAKLEDALRRIDRLEEGQTRKTRLDRASLAAPGLASPGLAPPDTMPADLSPGNGASPGMPIDKLN